MDNVIYTAAFVSERTMRQLQYIAAKHGVRLPKTPDRPHITLEFRPEKDHVRKELFSKKIFCHLVGYGNNGKNEGFYISVDGGDKELFKLFARLDVPHITMSFAEDAKPVDTAALDFVPLASVDQFEFEAQYDAFCGKSGLAYKKHWRD